MDYKYILTKQQLTPAYAEEVERMSKGHLTLAVNEDGSDRFVLMHTTVRLDAPRLDPREVTGWMFYENVSRERDEPVVFVPLSASSRFTLCPPPTLVEISRSHDLSLFPSVIHAFNAIPLVFPEFDHYSDRQGQTHG
jgi:hypothetical protein